MALFVDMRSLMPKKIFENVIKWQKKKRNFATISNFNSDNVTTPRNLLKKFEVPEPILQTKPSPAWLTSSDIPDQATLKTIELDGETEGLHKEYLMVDKVDKSILSDTVNNVNLSGMPNYDRDNIINYNNMETTMNLNCTNQTQQNNAIYIQYFHK